MATKKFSTFEYASHINLKDQKRGACISQDVFETPHGYVVVVVSDMERQGGELCRIAFERVKYYLDNEQDESAQVITKNALVYTSGYLHHMQKKDPSVKPGKLSCLCVLFHEEKIRYSWVGDVELFLFTGKKMYLLTRQEEIESSTSRSTYLGHRAIIEPGTDEGPLAPVAGDKLIMAAGALCKHIHTRETRKILKDSMPLQTQASRILHHSAESSADQPASSVIMLGFHDLSNPDRSGASLGIPVKAKAIKHPKGEEMAKKKKKSKPGRNNTGFPQPGFSWKTALHLAGLLLVIYLLYDLLNYGPSPKELPETTEVVSDTIIQAPEEAKAEAERIEAEAPVVLPGDQTYVVRSGDSWSRIYSQFGVCSWFIINHPPNTGRVGREGSLIAGERLHIPLRYSGKAELNPDFYREFSIDVVGSSCENARKELKDAFDEKL